ncbi:polysaccharide pyruvyl transferase family protein [Grimontia sp. AD028]|uniref:polysaccharide pyruvyl transferase family protein n=1 Tax=Grimontia sp. AD028 TaxID=1581149 RepID=UPI0018CF692F|nr:polysaccharide pyruvyl transferase family protein [Grimontia sp. AD028]
MSNIKNILLNSCKNEKVFYFSNPGNAGDSIIALGTFDYFNHIGLDYELISEITPDIKDSIVIYGGGGYLNSYYFVPDLLNEIKEKAKKLILLPQTTVGFEDFLSSLGENVIIFCREETSYAHVKEHALSAEVHLSHDMAFYIEISKYQQLKDYNTFNLIKRSAIKNKRDSVRIKHIWRMIRHKLSYESKASNHTLNAFRKDVESMGWDLDFPNIDISRSFAFTTQSEYKIRASACNFIQFIDKFDIVNTDRLHVAITAALLGKNVNFYSNSYFKCEAIYNQSLKENYKNVTWKGQEKPIIK